MAMDEETRRALMVKGLERYRKERDFFKFLSDTLALMPDEEMQLSKEVTDITVDRYDTIIRCAEEDKPFVAGYFNAAPEVYTAMDPPWLNSRGGRMRCAAERGG